MIFKQKEIKYVEYNGTDTNVLLKNNVLVMTTENWNWISFVKDNWCTDLDKKEFNDLKQVINRFKKAKIEFTVDSDLWKIWNTKRIF